MAKQPGDGFESHLLRPDAALSALVKAVSLSGEGRWWVGCSVVRGAGGSDAHGLLTGSVRSRVRLSPEQGDALLDANDRERCLPPCSACCSTW
jgi:hypothetical protein